MATRIHLCGAVSVEIAGSRVEALLPRRQGVLLLAFLALHRQRPVERETAMEALWPGERPPAARGAFRALLSKLRAAVGAEHLPGRERLQLVLPKGAWIDVEAAEEAVHRAETSVAAGAWGPAWGAARVAQMIPERGFLVGHDVPWVDERRRELTGVVERAEACIVACGLALGGGELMAAERAARRLARRRPLDEAATMQLMRVLEAKGDPSEALGAYEGLRLLLREEIGTAPGEELRAFHRRLLGAG